MKDETSAKIRKLEELLTEASKLGTEIIEDIKPQAVMPGTKDQDGFQVGPESVPILEANLIGRACARIRDSLTEGARQLDICLLIEGKFEWHEQRQAIAVPADIITEDELFRIFPELRPDPMAQILSALFGGECQCPKCRAKRGEG